MGQVKVSTVTVRKKKTATPQRKVEARRVVVNNQVKKLHTAAAMSKRSNNVSKPNITSTRKPVSRSTSKVASKSVTKLKKASNPRRKA